MDELIGTLSERTIFWLSDSDLKPDGLEILLRYKRNPKDVKDSEIIEFLEKAIEFFKKGYEGPEYVFRNVKHKKRAGKDLVSISPVKGAEEGIKKFFIELLKKCDQKEKIELMELLHAVLRRVEFEISEEK